MSGSESAAMLTRVPELTSTDSNRLDISIPSPIRCGACQMGLKGEAEAVMHAKQTGHSNFVEY